MRPARRSGGSSSKNEFKARFGSGSGRNRASSREVDAAEEEQEDQDHEEPSYKKRQRGFRLVHAIRCASLVLILTSEHRPLEVPQ